MAILSKKVMGFLYGMGAAVVIVGALFKLQHWTGADIMLIIGLLTEAAIFALSAFEPVEKDLDWSLVYPELAGGESTGKKAKGESPAEAQGLLSQKLDAMLKEAKIDGELMSSLGNSIKNFESAAKGIAPTVDSIAGQKKYSEELSVAAAQRAPTPVQLQYTGIGDDEYIVDSPDRAVTKKYNEMGLVNSGLDYDNNSAFADEEPGDDLTYYRDEKMHCGRRRTVGGPPKPEFSKFSSNGGESKRSTLMDLPEKNVNEDKNQLSLDMSVIMEFVIPV